MNHVVIITKNNLALTQCCVESVRAQDVPTKIHIYDNESTDGTKEWLAAQDDIIDQSSGVDLGVSSAWNFVLEILFEPLRHREGHKPQGWGAEHVLVLNNDVVLPSWYLRYLLSYSVDFVTGIAVDDVTAIAEPAPVCPLDPHPDFSSFLIHKRAWDVVGEFNEDMKLYCQDCDFHIRAHRKDIHLWKSNTPYFHINSQTMKRAAPEDRAEIQAQANKDREIFKSIYGCLPGTPEYEALFR